MDAALVGEGLRSVVRVDTVAAWLAFRSPGRALSSPAGVDLLDGEPCFEVDPMVFGAECVFPDGE